MRATSALLLAIVYCVSLFAQQANEERRANHYLDHLVLGVNDLESGIKEFQARTGVKPKKDGSNATLGTHSAIAGLGENSFIEIIAPDPEIDPGKLDPGLHELFYERLQSMDELTPFRWAIGTSNLERTLKFIRRASSRPSEIMAGSRKRGWGRAENWRWVKINIPDTPVSPLFFQWDDESKRPQERAPEGCELEVLHMNSRNYKSMLNLVATMQIDLELEGSESDSLSYELSCPSGEVVFEHASLTETRDRPGMKQKQ